MMNRKEMEDALRTHASKGLPDPKHETYTESAPHLAELDGTDVLVEQNGEYVGFWFWMICGRLFANQFKIPATASGEAAQDILDQSRRRLIDGIQAVLPKPPRVNTAA